MNRYSCRHFVGLINQTTGFDQFNGVKSSTATVALISAGVLSFYTLAAVGSPSDSSYLISTVGANTLDISISKESRIILERGKSEV